MFFVIIDGGLVYQIQLNFIHIEEHQFADSNRSQFTLRFGQLTEQWETIPLS